MSDVQGVIDVSGVHEFRERSREFVVPAGKLTDDPESPRDIVHENVLVLFPLALSFVFLLFGLVIAFSD